MMERQAAIHFHVWTQVEMLELILTVRRSHAFEVELVFKRDNEVIMILSKRDAPRATARVAGRTMDH